MFRKKAILPARPSFPKREEILEDLESAQPDDVVFTISPSKIIPLKANKGIYNTGEELDDARTEKDQSDDLSDPNTAYLKVKMFVKKLEDLQKYLDQLEHQKSRLECLEDSLKGDIQKIKEEISRSGYGLQ